MGRFDDIRRAEFEQRMARGLVVEVFIKELRILRASTLTTDDIDNYPVLVITPQLPPGYPNNGLEEFFVIPLTDRTVSDDAGPIMSELKAKSITVAAGNLFDTIYGPEDSKEESTEGLTFPER